MVGITESKFMYERAPPPPPPPDEDAVISAQLFTEKQLYRLSM